MAAVDSLYDQWTHGSQNLAGFLVPGLPPSCWVVFKSTWTDVNYHQHVNASHHCIFMDILLWWSLLQFVGVTTNRTISSFPLWAACIVFSGTVEAGPQEVAFRLDPAQIIWILCLMCVVFSNRGLPSTQVSVLYILYQRSFPLQRMETITKNHNWT